MVVSMTQLSSLRSCKGGIGDIMGVCVYQGERFDNHILGPGRGIVVDREVGMARWWT